MIDPKNIFCNAQLERKLYNLEGKNKKEYVEVLLSLLNDLEEVDTMIRSRLEKLDSNIIV